VVPTQPVSSVNERRWEREGVVLLQSERFFVEAFVVFDLVQSLFLERGFDPMQNVVYVVLLRPEGRSIFC